MNILDVLKVAVAALALCHLYNITIDNPSIRRAALEGYVLASERAPQKPGPPK